MRQLRDFCSRQEGWTVAREYVDRVSGKHGDREAFQDLFSAASRREFDVVLFWALERFSREGVYATLQHLQRLTSYGVGYRSSTSSIWIAVDCSRTPLSAFWRRLPNKNGSGSVNGRLQDWKEPRRRAALQEGRV